MSSMESSPPSLVCAAALDLDQPQVEFEIEFLERILARLPDQQEVLRVLANLLIRKEELDRALALDRRLCALRPRDCVAHYNLACTLSLVGRAAESLLVLSRALQLGYRDFAHLEVDPDLDNVRRHPAYESLLASYGCTG